MVNRAAGQDITLDNLTAFAGKSPALVTFGEALVGDTPSVWAPKTEPIARFLYELGRTPHKSVGWYQRMYSAAGSAADWSIGNQRSMIARFSTSLGSVSDSRITANTSTIISWESLRKRSP